MGTEGDCVQMKTVKLVLNDHGSFLGMKKDASQSKTRKETLTLSAF
jgi:hypothetical protein